MAVVGYGLTDEVAKMPKGRPGRGGSPHWFRPKTLSGELAKLGLKLWANHDKEQSDGLKKSPEYYE
jgi:hypothetical protein